MYSQVQDDLRRANIKLDPTLWGSRCSPHSAAQLGVEPAREGVSCYADAPS